MPSLSSICFTTILSLALQLKRDADSGLPGFLGKVVFFSFWARPLRCRLFVTAEVNLHEIKITRTTAIGKTRGIVQAAQLVPRQLILMLSSVVDQALCKTRADDLRGSDITHLGHVCRDPGDRRDDGGPLERVVNPAFRHGEPY